MVNNPFLTVVLGDFYAKSSFWYNNGITPYERITIDGVNSQFGLHQIIKESAHIIEFIFQGNWPHHKTYANISHKIQYSPPYERKPAKAIIYSNHSKYNV